MGMMNNCWYIVKPEISDNDEGIASINFRHPVEPGTKEGGWMQLSESEKINEAKQAAGAPEKQFTREEIEKHNKDDDCWIVVDGKVYDATSVLGWHPGGRAAVTVRTLFFSSFVCEELLRHLLKTRQVVPRLRGGGEEHC